MCSDFLLPETTVREAGMGPVIDLGEEPGETLSLTLGITRTIENESVEVGIWGSVDGVGWGSAALVSYPQKFYCGVYQLQLDLDRLRRVRFLRAQWHVNRWTKSAAKPLFTMYLLVQTSDQHLVAAGA